MIFPFIFQSILLSLGVATDAFVVATANGINHTKLNKSKILVISILFGLFQGLMPLLGFLLGNTFAKSVSKYAGFISFGIFFLLALKILVDVLKERNKKEEEKKSSSFTYPLLLVQAVATSIDAFIIGITLATSTFSIFSSIAIISFVTFLLVSLALLLGKYLGNILGKYAEWTGMIILFLLAIKNLIQALI